MKSDIVENVQDSTLCTLTGEKLVHNSGGPVHITNVIQNPIGPNKIQLNFLVEHVGPGEFYGRLRVGGLEENCDPSVRNTNKFNLGIEVTAQDPGTAVICYRLNNANMGVITMYNGAPQPITCVIERPSALSTRVYTETINIKTIYRYGQFIEQPIIVQAVPS